MPKEKIKLKAKVVDIRVVAITDTEAWHEDTQKACGKIQTVYFYDANQHTYCAEVQPSYLLYPLYAIAENEISEEMQENLHYGIVVENPEPSYYHVSYIDSLDWKKEGITHRLDGGLRYYAPDGKKHKQIMDAAQDYFQGNHPI